MLVADNGGVMIKRHRDILNAWTPAVDFALSRAQERPRDAHRASPSLKVNAMSGDTTELMIYGDIGGSWWDGGVSAADMAEMLRQINTPNLHVRINSRGGDAFDGVAIHTLLARYPGTVTTFNDGIAASAASVVLLAGSRVVVARNALTMIHDAMTYTYGGPATHKRSMELLEIVSDNIADMYAMRTGDDAAHWRGQMSMNGEDGTWLTGHDSVQCGLADEMTEPPEDPEISNRAASILVCFPNAPTYERVENASHDVETEQASSDCTEPDELTEQKISDMRERDQSFALLAAFTFGS